MQFKADIVILGPHSERIAVVEIKNQAGLSPEDGADRQNYMRVTGGPASYFMLVSQERAFVWKDGEEQATAIDMQPVVRRFLPRLAPGERLYQFQVETMVSFWLSELAAEWRIASEEPETTLESIGFLAAVRSASVLTEAVA